jgi:MYXO-CTERM domain-containing protein
MNFKRSAVSAGAALLLGLFSAGPLLAQQQPPPAEPVEPVQPRDAGDFDWGLLGLLGLLGLAGLAGGRRPTPGPRT